MIYTINLLSDTYDWLPLTFNGIPMKFKSKQTLLKAVKDNLGTYQQILLDDIVLEFLDGSEHQYKLFKDSFENKLIRKEKYDRDRQKCLRKEMIKK